MRLKKIEAQVQKRRYRTVSAQGSGCSEYFYFNLFYILGQWRQQSYEPTIQQSGDQPHFNARIPVTRSSMPV
jgi:hypothetical protein